MVMTTSFSKLANQQCVYTCVQAQHDFASSYVKICDVYDVDYRWFTEEMEKVLKMFHWDNLHQTFTVCAVIWQRYFG